MKKALHLVLVTAALLFSQGSNAQLKKFRLSLGLEGALPVRETFKNYYSFGGGLTARAEFRVIKKLAATLSAGGVGFLAKDLNSVAAPVGILNIPVKAGIKYFIVNHLYTMMELGVTTTTTYSTDNADNLVIDHPGSSFTYAPGIGVQLAGIDIGVRYEGFSVKNENQSFVALRLGFGF